MDYQQGFDPANPDEPKVIVREKIVVQQEDMLQWEKELINKQIELGKQRRVWIFTYSLYTIFLVLGILFSVNSLVNNKINKESIQNKIITVIKNKTDLNTVQHLYENRQSEKKSFFNIFNSNSKYYDMDIILEEILKDIKCSLYMKKDSSDLLIKLVDNIIEEHLQVYPFDKLENHQKELFENIQDKIPEEYSQVQNDIIKISDELYGQNLLVSRYLEKSNLSFWISIIAVVLSLFIGVFQIIQNINGHQKLNKRLTQHRKDLERDDNEEHKVEM